MKKNKEYILQKDIIIPAGTKFDNFTNEAKENNYYEAAIGIGKNCVEFLKIVSMDEIQKLEPSYFKKK